jgi:thiosulfate/3-mercaptopyruvate sulfurtransferase
MDKNISPIIQAADLLKLYQTKKLVIADASAGKNTKLNYQQKHLDGALFVDMDTQLASIKDDAANGGRHPLPTVEQFAETLGNLGISADSHVIIYDDKNGSNAAARFWWMLKAVGHNKVQVLNGGLQEAEKAGLPVNDKIVIPQRVASYPIANWQLPLSSIKEVEKVTKDDNYMVIDVRSNERYKGENEPIDLVAGHIPGAVNVPFTENLDANGLFLSPEELKAKYQSLFSDLQQENIIVHCGSGVTACHTLLAIDYAGLAIPKLYVGSWSEWSRQNKPIATTGK